MLGHVGAVAIVIAIGVDMCPVRGDRMDQFSELSTYSGILDARKCIQQYGCQGVINRSALARCLRARKVGEEVVDGDVEVGGEAEQSARGQRLAPRFAAAQAYRRHADQRCKLGFIEIELQTASADARANAGVRIRRIRRAMRRGLRQIARFENCGLQRRQEPPPCLQYARNGQVCPLAMGATTLS